MKTLLENKRFITGFRILFFLGVMFGILVNIINSEYPWQMFGYFTIQSNILVLFMLLFLILYKGQINNRILIAKQTVTVSILVTFLVFHLLLAGVYSESFDSIWDYIGNFFVHTFTPVLMTLDFLFLDRHEKTRPMSFFWSLSFPLLYFIFAETYALLGGAFVYGEYVSSYPYYFLDPALVGGWGVFFYSLGIMAGILALSFGIGYFKSLLHTNK